MLKNKEKTTLKKQLTYNQERLNANNLHNITKNESTKGKFYQKNISSKLTKNGNETNKISINKNILKDSPHHKRNHSQLNISSGFEDIQSNKNENEFEKRIQSNQDNLSPGVTIGRDGKVPVEPNFVKKKYKDMLTQYEMTEIDYYTDVYFVGNSISKKITDGSFDDEKTFQYKAKIGDHLAYRYEILSIIGKGVFGTIFKCIDHKTKQKVAIKVLTNTPLMHQQGKIEIENLKLLSCSSSPTSANAQKQVKQSPISKRSSSVEVIPKDSINANKKIDEETTNSNLKHVIKIIDNFFFRYHICIVTEILGESLRDFMIKNAKSKLKLHQENQNVDPNTKRPYQIEPLPAQMVKLIAYQIIEGLASIHKKKIIHGDLKPENILFTNESTSKSPDECNKKTAKNNCPIISRKDSDLFKLSFQPPQKITSHFTVSFSAIDNSTLLSKIKIIDFGSSCKQKDLVFSKIQNRFYRAPEVILKSSYGPAIDIWSAGCIIAELFVGVPLFPAKNDVDLLAKFIETLGTPPLSVIKMKADFQSKSTKKIKDEPQQNKFFGDDGKLLHVSTQPVPMKTRLTSFLKSSDTMMIDFLTKCLEWDKNKRITAAKLLKHPWIAEFSKQNI